MTGSRVDRRKLFSAYNQANEIYFYSYLHVHFPGCGVPVFCWISIQGLSFVFVILLISQGRNCSKWLN